MKNYKTKGIILKTMKLGEADKIITIFTEEQGKVAAVAKGVRRVKSRFGARLEIFTNLRLLIHRGRTLDTITQADIVGLYPRLVSDLDRIDYGYAMLELTDKITPDRSPEPRVYQMLVAALDCLDKTEIDSDAVLAAFDLKIMALTGFQPDIKNCAVCGKNDPPPRNFSPRQGGMVHRSCQSNDGADFSVRVEAIDLAGKLLYSPFAAIGSLKTPSPLLAEVDRLIKSHILYHLNLRLRVRDYMAKRKSAAVAMVAAGADGYKTEKAIKD